MCFPSLSQSFPFTFHPLSLCIICSFQYLLVSGPFYCLRNRLWKAAGLLLKGNRQLERNTEIKKRMIGVIKQNLMDVLMTDWAELSKRR